MRVAFSFLQLWVKPGEASDVKTVQAVVVDSDGVCYPGSPLSSPGVMAGLCVSGGWEESRGRGADPGFGIGRPATTAQTFQPVDLGQHPCKGILSLVQVLFIYR